MIVTQSTICTNKIKIINKQELSFGYLHRKYNILESEELIGGITLRFAQAFILRSGGSAIDILGGMYLIISIIFLDSTRFINFWLQFRAA
jgi:hypothetical protein